MKLYNNQCILVAVFMATNLFEVSNKYFDILIGNMIFFIQKKQFYVFFQIFPKICGFFNF